MKKITNKFIGFTIYGFLGLSIWTLLSLGIDILPLVSISIMDVDQIEKLNNIFLNLAYSYFAGFIIYSLTVTIPEKRKLAINKPLINTIIEDYYNYIATNFFFYYVNNKAIKLRDVDKRFISEFHEMLKQKFDLGTLEDSHFRSKKDRSQSIKNIINSNSDFINKILPLTHYMSDKQQIILNEIRKHNINKQLEILDIALECGAITKGVDREIFKHFDLVRSLYLSIKEKTKTATNTR